MSRFIILRLLHLIPLLFLVSLFSFGLFQLQPGDPVRAYLPRESLKDPAAVERVRRALGLDQPWPARYLRWLGRVVRGDLGRSLITGEPVAARLRRAVPRTLQLTLAAFALALAAGVALGVLAAVRRNSLADRAVQLAGTAGIAIPEVALGAALVYLFAVRLRWLPALGTHAPGHEGEFWDGLHHMLLPVAVMASGQAAILSRFVRSCLLEVLNRDFIRTARAKGLSERVVLFRHGLRGALAPVITLVGLGLAGFVGGAVAVERIFAWPGMGRLTVEALFQQDYPVIMAITMLFALLTALGSLAADLAYALVDPRVRFS